MQWNKLKLYYDLPVATLAKRKCGRVQIRPYSRSEFRHAFAKYSS
jgi:hypothetical protein